MLLLVLDPVKERKGCEMENSIKIAPTGTRVKHTTSGIYGTIVRLEDVGKDPYPEVQNLDDINCYISRNNVPVIVPDEWVPGWLQSHKPYFRGIDQWEIYYAKSLAIKDRGISMPEGNGTEGPQTEIPGKGEKEMEKSIFTSLFDATKSAATDGTNMAVAYSAAEAVADTVERLMGDKFPSLLNRAPLSKFKPAIVCLAVIGVCSAWPDKVPKANELKSYARSAMTASFYEAMRPYLKPLLEAVRNLWNELPGLSKEECE